MDLVEILMVEDNPGDALLARAELEDAHVCNNLHVVPDAESALAFLRHEGEFTDRPRPDLILLDLNLPGMGGSEFLSAIKSESSFKEIPVAVLTSGGEHEAIVRKQSAQADVFVSKPVGIGFRGHVDAHSEHLVRRKRKRETLADEFGFVVRTEDNPAR